MKVIAIFVSLLFSHLSIAHNPDKESIETGEDLIRMIYNTHSSNWYKHLTFKQNIFRYRDDSLLRNEVWLVAYSAPNKLHIRYKDFDSGRGWLGINDTLYSFNHGKFIGQRPRLHKQIILGFDVYIVPPEEVIPKIYSMNFDLSILSTTSINGNNVYQVGDANKHCFWVKMDDLLFYGIRRVSETGVSDVFFENYKLFYGKPVATELQYFRNGKMSRYEKYFEIRLPSSLPEEFFDVKLFEDTRCNV